MQLSYNTTRNYWKSYKENSSHKLRFIPLNIGYIDYLNDNRNIARKTPRKRFRISKFYTTVPESHGLPSQRSFLVQFAAVMLFGRKFFRILLFSANFMVHRKLAYIPSFLAKTMRFIHQTTQNQMADLLKLVSYF